MALILLSILALAVPNGVSAHTGQQSLVLLLPTGIYIKSGGIVVLATALVAALMRHEQLRCIFTPRALFSPPKTRTTAPSISASAILLALILLGFFGPHDPLANLMTLGLWTVVWIGLVVLCGVFGNLWAWLNPWSGLYALLFAQRALKPLILPERAGYWPAIAGFLAFTAFGISSPDAADPGRLAILASIYWIFTFLMMILFGSEIWLKHGEFITVFISLLSKIAPIKRTDPLRFGTPGWRIVHAGIPAPTLAIFALILLGTGTFDGFNETFFWLTQLGINPLAFPGRSAIVSETIIGLLAANILLIAVFYICIRLTAPPGRRSEMFCRQSLAIVPIALGYHFAHFLPSFMVDIQYTLKALTDPMNSGADYLGLGRFYVTTGFFNTTSTVRIIFLAQAAGIVLAHVHAILLSHTIASDYFKNRREVLISQIPLSTFMVGYTILGLWLLATPKGA